MRNYRKGQGTELEKVICNKCGKELKVENGILMEDCFEADQTFGYFSSRDGRRYRFDLCGSCFDGLLSGLLLGAGEEEITELL